MAAIDDAWVGNYVVIVAAVVIPSLTTFEGQTRRRSQGFQAIGMAQIVEILSGKERGRVGGEGGKHIDVYICIYVYIYIFET